MKNFRTKLFIFIFNLFISSALSAAAFSQVTIITQEEFGREINKASQITEAVFPRRETESEPNQTAVFTEGKTEPVEIVLSRSTVKEFLAKDKIRYEFKVVTNKGITSNKRIEINSYCYDESNGEKWATSEISCDQKIYSISMPPEKREFFSENGTFDAKPIKILRTVETGRVYKKGESPYIHEYLYYLDSAGRLIKREFLIKKGTEKGLLENSTIYEYDVKIMPISVPDAEKK